MVTALLVRYVVFPTVRLGKDPLPGPFRRGKRVFSIEGTRNGNLAPAFGDVVLVDKLNSLKVLHEGLFEGLGKHGNAVLRSLSVAYEDFVPLNIDILYP
jgi:hypothetical protein